MRNIRVGFFIATVNKVLLFYLYYKINWGVSLSKDRQRDKRKGAIERMVEKC